MSGEDEVRNSVSLTEGGVTYLWFVDDLGELERQLILDHVRGLIARPAETVWHERRGDGVGAVAFTRNQDGAS